MLDEICTSLEVSKELKKLGIKGETCLYWRNMFSERNGYKEPQLQQLQVIREGDGDIANNLFISAYTLETILEMLPKSLEIPTPLFEEGFYKAYLEVNQCVDYIGYDITEDKYHQRFNDDNLVTVAGKLLIKLKQEKII